MSEGGPSRRRRTLEIPRAPAIGWDVALGHADDPAEFAGRAALAARYVAHALRLDSASGAVSGWIRRHQLGRHHSRFSFWAPDAAPDLLAAAVSRIPTSPAGSVLRSLVAAQLAQAHHQDANPVKAIFRAIDAAAWGVRDGNPLGDAQSLRTVSGGDFAGYLGQCRSAARLLTVDSDGVLARTAPAPSPWRGDLIVADHPGELCRVAVAVRLAPPFDDLACASVLAALLDGADGLLSRRMRTEAGIAYGTFATAQDEAAAASLILGITLARLRLVEAVDHLRSVLDELDKGPIETGLLERAGARVAHATLTRLDGPFGALDDYRRTQAGQPGLGEIARLAPAVVADLAQPARLSPTYRPAVAYAGDPAGGVADILERLR